MRKKLAAAIIGAQLLAGSYVASMFLPTVQADTVPVTISASGPATAAQGSTIAYTITLMNNSNTNFSGESVAFNINGSANILAGTTFLGSDQFNCVAISNATAKCDPINIGGGQSISFHVFFRVNAACNAGIDAMFDLNSTIPNPPSPATWSNDVHTTVSCNPMTGGNTTTTVNTNANVGVNNMVTTTAQNNTQVWQQQQNNMPVNTWMNANINPTANATTNNMVNAAATNNNNIASPGGWWGGFTNTTLNTNAATTVNNGVNTTAQNNTALWQQQQNNMPWGSGMNVNLNPTANATTNNQVNAGAFNFNTVWHW